MKKMNLLIFALLMTCGSAFGQNKPFLQLEFLLGKWAGTGTGFGKNILTKSK